MKPKLFEFDWIGHPEVIEERGIYSTINLWHCLDSRARGQVEDVIASLEWLGGPHLKLINLDKYYYVIISRLFKI